MTNTRSIFERIMQRVEMDPNGGCWLWGGSLKKSGYGHMSASAGKTEAPHRAMFKAVNGPIPDGLYVCHKCDVRACVNPAHLWLGTARDNALDRDKKARRTPPAGASNGMARLSEKDVAKIRSCRASGMKLREIMESGFPVTLGSVARVARGDTWK